MKPGVFYLQKMMNFMKMRTFYKTKTTSFYKKTQFCILIKNSNLKLSFYKKGNNRDPCPILGRILTKKHILHLFQVYIRAVPCPLNLIKPLQALLIIFNLSQACSDFCSKSVLGFILGLFQKKKYCEPTLSSEDPCIVNVVLVFLHFYSE